MDCDVRDFIPHEQGGFEGLPTHKEIAESMGLTYPSNDVRILGHTYNVPLLHIVLTFVTFFVPHAYLL